MLVMIAMFAAPHQHGILKGGSAENQREQPHRPLGLKSNVREEPVITQTDAEAARKKQGEEKSDLKPVEAEVPEVKRNSSKGEEERSAKK